MDNGIWNVTRLKSGGKRERVTKREMERNMHRFKKQRQVHRQRKRGRLRKIGKAMKKKALYTSTEILIGVLEGYGLV